MTAISTPVMPTDFPALLKKHGLAAVRDRGQHFLFDEKILNKIVEAAGVRAGDAVLEIGPGPGALTMALLGRGARVLAVELDRRFAPFYAELFPGRTCEIRWGNILDFSNANLAKALAGGGEPVPRSSCPAKLQRSGVGEGGWRLVANLPYGLTARILEKFITEEPWPRSLTVMVQREVADRILAGSGRMSALAVMVQTFGRPRRVINVPRGAFRPPPRVDSAVVHIEVKPTAEREKFFAATTPEKYFALVRTAFSSPRKKISNTLAALVPAESWTAAVISPDCRPERLMPEDWRRLAVACGKRAA